MEPEKLDPITKFFYKLTQPKSQIIAIILTAIIITITNGIALKRHAYFEALPDVKIITPKVVKEWQADPAQVTVGFHIRNFQTFDLVKNDFVVDGIIWFEFDPAIIALETIGKFTFDKGEFLYKSEPTTKLIDDKFFARYDIKLHFSFGINYRRFPFDNHRMSINLVNRFVPPSELVYKSNSFLFTIAKNIDFPGWIMVRKDVITGYSESRLEEDNRLKTILIPKTIFTIDFQRSGRRNVNILLFPLYLIWILGLLSLAFDPVENPMIISALATGTITALLTYRFVMENMTPKIGYYVFSDSVYLALLLIGLFEFMFGLTAVHMKKLTKFLIIIRGIIFIFCIALFIFVFIYFLLRPLS